LAADRHRFIKKIRFQSAVEEKKGKVAKREKANKVKE